MIAVVYNEILLPEGVKLIERPPKKTVAIDLERIFYLPIHKSTLRESWRKANRDVANKYFDLWIANKLVEKKAVPNNINNVLCFGSVLSKGEDFLIPCIRREAGDLKIDYIEMSQSICNGFSLGYLTPPKSPSKHQFY